MALCYSSLSFLAFISANLITRRARLLSFVLLLYLFPVRVNACAFFVMWALGLHSSFNGWIVEHRNNGPCSHYSAKRFKGVQVFLH